MPQDVLTPPQLQVTRAADDTLLVQLAGSWRLQDELPDATEVQQHLETGPAVRRMAFDAQGITAWDTGLLTFLLALIRQNQERQIETDQTALPEGMQRLLALATAVPERAGAARTAVRTPWLAVIGTRVIASMTAAQEMLTFLGEACLAFGKLLRGRASYRRADVLEIMQASGSQALPIVPLISGLIGLILAFMGAVQLRAGDRLYMYSDGLMEAMNPDNELFGQRRIEALIDETRDVSIDDSLDALIDAAVAWQGSDSFTDDLSLLALEVTGG